MARIIRRHLLVGCALWVGIRVVAGQKSPQIRNDGYEPAPAANSKILDIDGPVHYVEFDGPPSAGLVVLVHGIGGSHVTWLPLAARLSATYRVVVIDLPGHGLTPLGTRRASLRGNQQLLGKFVDALSDGPLFLVGHSMGALACLRVASRRPRRTRAVVLVDPAVRDPGGPTVPDWVQSKRFRSYAVSVLRGRTILGANGPEGHERIIDAQLRMSCSAAESVGVEIRARYLEVAVLREGQGGAARAFLQAVVSLARFTRSERRIDRLGAAVRAPVLVLHGEDDLLVELPAARAFVGRHPDWRLETASGAGHVPMLEQPDWTAGHVLGLFSSAGSLT